jgi:hypothetical protein
MTAQGQAQSFVVVMLLLFMSRQQKALQNHNTKTADKSFENVAKFRYLIKKLKIKLRA